MKNLLLFATCLCCQLASSAAALDIYVSPAGNDQNPGTQEKPFATLGRAQQAARARAGKEAVTVNLKGGLYELPETLVFTAADSGTKQFPVVYQAFADEKAVISGGTTLKLIWKPYRDGILQAEVPKGFSTDQLFVDGKLQSMARYPDFNPNERVFNGWAEDAFSRERAERWADPAGGIIHSMHHHLWGDYHYEITGKDAKGEVTYVGGWQNNRQMGMHPKFRFVENIFEELDAPGEWFLNTKTSTLYWYPLPEVDPAKAVFQAPKLRHLIEFRGDESNPVKFVELRGLEFEHALRTFMDNKEPLLRSDWTTYRGGAIFFNGAEDCSLVDCTMENLGGNTIFVNNYNRRIAIRGCLIQNTGAGGISFIGDPNAVRSPLFEYNQVQDLEVIDLKPGPKTSNYPADCLVEDCLITKTSQVEKQTAPIQIEMSQGITVRSCSIYDVPRAGINIGSGCWGGHVIEFCDVFDTVKETGDHGSFNSWGRDRFWRPNVGETNAWVEKVPALPLLDVVKPIVIRNNRWRCDHGWDVDLDDGSSNYQITNNLMLRGGLKLREGFNRTVENNIMIRGGIDPHVWYARSGDVVRRNIVGRANYGEARMFKDKPWGEEMDYQLVHAAGRATPSPATALQGQSQRDENSLVADAEFVDPATGDYQVKPGSPALELGFKNFPMDQFGVKKASLRAMARTPVLPGQETASSGPARDPNPRDWLGLRVRNIVGQSEMSAYGLPGETGVLVVELPASHPFATAGLVKNDVILKANGRTVDSLKDLLAATAGVAAPSEVTLTISRLQKTSELKLPVTDAVPIGNGPLVKQDGDGKIRLTADTAEIIGTSARKQGSGAAREIGNWKDENDCLRWQVNVQKPGTFEIVLTYAMDVRSGGAEATLSAAGQTVPLALAETGGWNSPETIPVGALTVKAPGVVVFTLKPTYKAGEAIMNFREFVLSPKAP